MEQQQQLPTPKPRRAAPNPPQTQYENVSIEIVNKSTNLDQQNSINIDSKIPNKPLKENNDKIITNNKCDEQLNVSSYRPIPAPRRICKIEENIYSNETSNVPKSPIPRNITVDYRTKTQDESISPSDNNAPFEYRTEITSDMNNLNRKTRRFSDDESSELGFYMKKTASDTASLSSDTSSTDNKKFKNPSPSDLLKSLGTTSRLLTESITERVANKAKGKKEFIDKNIKISQERFNTWGSETVSRLKSVRKKINAQGMKTLSLIRPEKASTDPNIDRPQTVPSNDEVFHSISFESPLNKTSNMYDLTKVEPTYEIPKSVYTPNSSISSNEAVENQTYEATTSKPINLEKKEDNKMPAKVEEPSYGKLNIINRPQRPRRKKNDAPEKTTTDPAADFQKFIEERVSNLSTGLRDGSKKHENFSHNPQRSESWTYYKGNDYDYDDEEGSSPEPIYSNQEMTYGQICDMESKDAEKFLFPQKQLNRNEMACSSQSASKCTPEDILDEFDPLMTKAINEFPVDKSNQLLLLEHLLQQETYGTVLKDINDLSIKSTDSSDDENATVELLPVPPKRIDSCKPTKVEKKRTNKLNITTGEGVSSQHAMQNLESEMAAPYLSRIDETESTSQVDLSRPPKSQTSWFVAPYAESPPVTPSKSKNTAPNFEHIGEPPSYSEAMASTTNVTTFTEPKSPTIQSDSYNRTTVKSVFSSVLNKVDALKRKTSFRNTKPSEMRVVLEMIPKPQLSQLLVRHESPLIKFPSGVVEDILKDMQNRKAIIRERKFQTFQDQEMKCPKESFPLEYITTLQCVSNNKITDSATPLYCFEITTAIPKNQSSMALSTPNMIVTNSNSGNYKSNRICHLYGVMKESERNVWMQKILESLTDVFPASYTCQYYRAGWCYLKNSISAKWSGAWILLKKRKRRLMYHCDANCNLEKVDLRKARCIALKESDDSLNNLYIESGPILMIDCPPHTIYLVMSSPRETKIWRHIIREVAHNSGSLLHEQQLTKFNVPVILDKCINFIYIHGCMSEGIYRKSGAENAIHKLLSQFRTDAFSVEITRSEYSEHDVANVLKRFMRDLPQKLLGKYSASFISITYLPSKAERLPAYKELMKRLTEIEYQTLKKLIGHLFFIQSLKAKNKMGVDNLSMIWGATLLQNVGEEEMVYSQAQGDVISDIITLYKNIFPLSAEEIIKEQQMFGCLQKYYAAAENLSDSVKKSGDLKVWITINRNPDDKKEEKPQVNVTLTPTKTAYDVCKELSAKSKLPVHALTLHEVILNENLDRPIHHNEKVFNTVLRWSYWDEEDRKNNYLVLKPIDMLNQVQRALKNLATLAPAGKLKFADNKSKSLKCYQVELRDGTILVTKTEKNSHIRLHEISLQNVTAYLGCEKKRELQWGWAITLIENDDKKIKRSRDSPYIGYVIGGNAWEERIIWYSNIWNSLYGQDILPPADILLK